MTNKSSSSSGGKGLVQIFTGNGKGKTSAALGTVIRAVGHSLRVCVILFMKGNFPYGEQKVLSRLPDVSIAIFGRTSFVDPNNVHDEDRKEGEKALAAAREAILSGKYDLVVLDEINVASAWGLIGIEDVVRLIKDKPDGVELILTGRYADKRLVELADLVTEMKSIKHPFDSGIAARPGFDY